MVPIRGQWHWQRARSPQSSSRSVTGLLEPQPLFSSVCILLCLHFLAKGELVIAVRGHGGLPSNLSLSSSLADSQSGKSCDDTVLHYWNLESKMWKGGHQVLFASRKPKDQTALVLRRLLGENTSQIPRVLWRDILCPPTGVLLATILELWKAGLLLAAALSQERTDATVVFYSIGQSRRSTAGRELWGAWQQIFPGLSRRCFAG